MSAPRRDRTQGGAVSTEYLFLMLMVALVVVVGAVAYGATLDRASGNGAAQVDTTLAN